MERRIRFPLRLKFLIALLLLVTGVVSVITFTMANLFHEDKRTYVTDLVSLVAVSSAEECRSLLEGYRERLLSFSRVLRDEAIPRERRQALLNGYFSDFPELVTLDLYEDGKLAASAHDAAELERSGVSLEAFEASRRERPLPIEPILAGRVHVENSSFPRKLRCLTMALAAPEDEGLRPAIVAAVIRLDALQRLATRSSVFDVSLADGGGILLAHRDPARVEGRRSAGLDHASVDLVTRGNAAVTREYDLDGNRMIGGVASVGLGQVTATAGLPAAAAYMASRSLLGRLAVISLLVLLFVAVASVFMARRITGPVERLAAATQDVGKGLFDRQVAIKSGDEIGGLALSFNRMAGELQSRETALKNAQAQLLQSEKMAAFGLLGAGIAHEVKNPLAGILGCAQISLRKAEPGTVVRANLELIEKETKRCKTIIENLLKFARQDRAVLEEIDPNAPVQDAISIVRHQLELQKVKLEVDLADGLAKIRANGNQLQQVLMNLMINAQQAMGERGGSVRVVTRRTSTEGEIEIGVLDTGPGIPIDIQNRIFEPFFTTKPGGKGTGLGLSVSYGIIKDHGGEITVESEPGHGAAFLIRLPALAQAPEDSRSAASPVEVGSSA